MIYYANYIQGVPERGGGWSGARLRASPLTVLITSSHLYRSISISVSDQSVYTVYI